MFVVHVITTIDRGGAEKALLNLSSQQVKIGLTPIVVYLKGVAALKVEFVENGVKVVDTLQGKSPLFQILQLRKLLKSLGESTVVHAHLPRAELITKLALRSQPFIITRHNAESFLPHAWSSISRALSRFVTKYATVVVISKAVANFVLRNGEVDRRKNLNVIYYSFQRKRNTAKVATEIQTSSIERGQSVRLGTVARLTEQKGLIFLLMGMKQLMENGINFTLEIMGSGPQRDLIKRQIVELNLTENVHLIGVSDDPFNFMSSLDFFVLTSKYEGFGLVLLEAMDTQTPIVATNISAIPEVLGESHPGLFAPNSLTSFCETLIALLGNETLRRSCMLIQNERLAFFTEYPQEERYRTLYGELPLLRLSQH